MTLKEKIAKSKKIIREANKRFPKEKLAVAWTGRKDSTFMLHLIKDTFGRVPFLVVFNDSTMEFPEVYEFIDKLTQEWNLNLARVLHLKKELAEFHRTRDPEKRKELFRLMKISAIKRAIQKYKLAAFMVALRWDGQKSRSKEKYFSPRKDHIRVHPILHFTEKDIWGYIKAKKVPYLSLYDKGHRFLREAPFIKPAKNGKEEKFGREDDKKLVMQRLKDLGYW